MAQSALSVFAISPVAANAISLLPETLLGGQGKANLLLRRYSETATRTRTGIVGAISGCTLRAAYSDPVLTIDLSGWVITRGGFANCAPGTLIDSSVIANWRNGTTLPGQEDHFGWDVNSAHKFIVQDPSFTRVPGGLSEVSLKLILECTGVGGSSGGGNDPPVDNGGDTVPEVGRVTRIVTVYTDKGNFQYLTDLLNPTINDLGFGSDTGAWDEGGGHRPISNGKPSNPDQSPLSPPINVLGINIQASSGTGSVAGGAWIAGSAAEVTGGGQTLKPAGLDTFFFTLSDAGAIDRYNTFMVTGYASEASALASIGHSAGDFTNIYSKPASGLPSWTKGPSSFSPETFFWVGA